MNVKTSLPSMVLAACLCLLLAGCSRTPAGYANMVERNGGSHPDTISDPKIAADFAGQWVQDWKKSLAFFTKELDSTDPAHVKTSIWCLGLFVVAVEKSSGSAEEKAQFEKDFPSEKLKQVLTTHPEYEEWYYGLRRTKFGANLPAAKVAPTP